jgi:hypothetical protein
VKPDATPQREGYADPAVDPEHPWLGLASFTEATRAYFFGREEEVAELARRVQRKLLTILFGQSGLGKTSILRAGIVPKLRPEGYCPIYVRLDYSPEAPSPSEQIKQAIFRATQESGEWTQVGVATSGESLWEFLHHRDDVLRDASGRTLIPLLIFDQFEEVFTLAQTDDFGRRRAAEFLEDLGDLVENRAPDALESRIELDDSAAERFDFARADYRVLIALREDYLAHLEGLKGSMPSITQNRMRLARMTGVQALSAVEKPGGHLVTREVAEAIVRFIAGGSEIANAEVEPSLLSLICRELNNARIAQGRAEISADLLAGSRDTILSEFYERALADQPAGVRHVIEDLMLTDSGYRESLAEERVIKAFAAAGAPPGTLGTLVNRRLLRIEERLDVRRVELTHDVLCGVVKASRDLRLEREARDEAERKLAAQRERERATRQALVRARKIAAACAALAVIAVGSAIFGYVSMKRAQDAEARADETRQLAETARGEAEKLVVYLLDDFYLELAPVGRLDIVTALARRALEYYNALPEPLRTTQTERNRALALVRYGSVLRTQDRLDEGRQAIDEAVKILSDMREQGDRSETTAIGLALGYHTQARLMSSVEKETEALASSTRAVDVIRPLASAPDASIALRRAYGEVLNLQGFLEMSTRRHDAALATLEGARASYRAIDDLTLKDLAAAAGYAESTAWLVQTLVRAGRGDEARRAVDEAVDVAKQVLDRRPGHMQALRAQALATSPLAGHLRDDMQLAEALVLADATLNAWREFVRLDPGNAISWSNLHVAHLQKASTLQAMGRLSDAAATHRSALELDRQTQPTVMLRLGLAIHAGRLAVVESLRGNGRQAEEALVAQQRFRQWVGSRAESRLTRAFGPLSGDYWRTIAARAAGDSARALEVGGSFVQRAEQLEPATREDRHFQIEVLLDAYLPMAHAAYALKDYATVDRLMTRSSALRKELPDSSLQARREASVEHALAAMALARLGRTSEARAIIGPALEFQRELAARNREDPTQRLDFAKALYAAALAGAGEPKALLAEAAAQVGNQPPEWQRTVPITFWRARIHEEQARRR